MIKKCLLSATLCVLPVAALAQPSYNYIDLSYEALDIDGTSFEGSGIGLEGSMEFGNDYFVELSHSSTEDQGVDVDRNSIAIGTHLYLNQDTSWFIKGGFHQYDIGPFDEDGFLIGAGVRSNLTDKLEVNGAITYEDADSGSMSVLKLGALYHINQSIGVFTEIGRNDDGDEYLSLGGRFKF